MVEEKKIYSDLAEQYADMQLEYENDGERAQTFIEEAYKFNENKLDLVLDLAEI